MTDIAKILATTHGHARGMAERRWGKQKPAAEAHCALRRWVQALRVLRVAAI
jgi:hypothetical protein